MISHDELIEIFRDTSIWCRENPALWDSRNYDVFSDVLGMR